MHVQHSTVLVTTDILSPFVTILYVHCLVSVCGSLNICYRLWVALVVVGRVTQLSHRAPLWLPQTLLPVLLLWRLPIKHVFEPCTVVLGMVHHHQQRTVFLAKLYHLYIMVCDLRVRGKVINKWTIHQIFEMSHLYEYPVVKFILQKCCVTNDGQWHVGLYTACLYITEVICSGKCVVHIMKFQNMNPIFPSVPML